MALVCIAAVVSSCQTVSLRCFTLMKMVNDCTPALDSTDLRLSSVPSIAASKALIVSRGRSHRERVGFERSGSAAQFVVSQSLESVCARIVWRSIPIGLPKASACWTLRRDVRVDCSSAAVTGRVSAILASRRSRRLSLLGGCRLTRLCFIHGSIGVCLAL